MIGTLGAALGPALLAALLVASIARGRVAALDRHWNRALAALLTVGALWYVGSIRVDAKTDRIHIHYWDVYHYYIGTKYFAELGQSGLYEATVVADFEDDRAGFRPGRRIRDLRDSAHELSRGSVLRHRREIVARFGSRERWREFKRDIAYFRDADPRLWRSSEVQRDHGYNGTPLMTAVWGGLANLWTGETSTFLSIAVWIDLVAVAALTGWLSLRLGAAAGMTFALFWLANPLNDYTFTGGALFRHAFLVAIAAGVATLRSGARAASGAWFAVAAGLRLFPVVFPLAVLASDVVRPERRALLRADARFFAAFAATAVLLVAATSWVSTPDGGNAWWQQVRQVGSRESVQAPNGISLRFPFLYAPEHDVAAVMESARRGEPIDWLAETDRTFAARRPAYLAVLAALGLIGLAYVRRVDACEALLAGGVALYGVWIVSHYYYALLAVVPLMLREKPRAVELLAAGLFAIGASQLIPGLGAPIDRRFAVASALVGATLAAICAWRLAASFKRPAPGERACA